mmetsp:Transcript_35513/g.64654  ORF Transcript_35513/g.64654 Transcript_35513/m.64654 type:complete len:372 (-) Transcript_35513:39-1154(-)
MRVQLHLAGLDLGEVQHIVDDGQQGLGRRAGLGRIVVLARRQLGTQQQVEHAQGAAHRGADLMAHVGEEVALGLAGRLGRDTGAHQVHLDPVALGHIDKHLHDVEQLAAAVADGAGAAVDEQLAAAGQRKAALEADMVELGADQAVQLTAMQPARPEVRQIGQLGAAQRLGGAAEHRRERRVHLQDQAAGVADRDAHLGALEHAAKPQLTVVERARALLHAAFEQLLLDNELLRHPVEGTGQLTELGEAADRRALLQVAGRHAGHGCTQQGDRRDDLPAQHQRQAEGQQQGGAQGRQQPVAQHASGREGFVGIQRDRDAPVQRRQPAPGGEHLDPGIVAHEAAAGVTPQPAQRGRRVARPALAHRAQQLGR